MNANRDEILKTDDILSGVTYEELPPSTLRGVCRRSIHKCIKINKRFAVRYDRLCSQRPVDKSEEKEWLDKIVETWFCKKWGNRKAEHQSLSKRKTSKCTSCGKGLVCVDCDDIQDVCLFKVRLTFLVQEIKVEQRFILSQSSSVSGPSSVSQPSRISLYISESRQPPHWSAF